MKRSNEQLNKKPVIFLAFANDRVREGAYLRNLPEELRSIRAALVKAQNAGLCDIVERANATVGDLMDVFQDKSYKDRIAVFHYGGHANGYKLLLESFAGGPSSVYKEDLVSFLAGQNSLKLVFLNACSTVQHARELTNAGIPAVIGTLEAIEDNTAASLAARFYNGLANGLPIERVWQEAQSAIQLRVGPSNAGAVYQDGAAADDDRFPWEIHYKEGAEKVKEWNLPDAVHNPLFGLPPIPGRYTLPHTPFHFLRRCTKEHARIFFGRSYYIRALYNLVTTRNASPVIFLYGQSGAGKSSVLEAGLLPRLEESHTVLYLRRNAGAGLAGTLERALDHRLASQNDPDTDDDLSGTRKWKQLETLDGKPLLVILDQVEEAFTRYNKTIPDEFPQFIQLLKSLFQRPADYPQGKLILGFRKEYLPEIDDRFKQHELPRVPVFLQPLNRDDIVEVVTGLTRTPRLKEQYCLEIEEPLPIIIADELSRDNDSPVAPTLQIILTKLWENSQTSQFSTQRKFSIHRYRQLQNKGLLMQDFFKQQMEKLRKWNRDAVRSGLALDVLAFHTTPLGTSRSRSLEDLHRVYCHRLDIIDSLREKLKEFYLLTDASTHDPHMENETRLVHDTLAPVVINEYNHAEQPGQRAARILAAKLGESRETNEESGFIRLDLFLDKADLEILQQGKKGMKALTPAEEELLAKSIAKKHRSEHRKKVYKLVRQVLIIFVIVFAAVAVWQWDKALKREKEARANFQASQAQLKLEKDPTQALQLAKKAKKIHDNESVKKTIYKIYRENVFYTTIARLPEGITRISVSPSGKTILTGSPDGIARLWDSNGKLIREFKGHNGQVLSAAVSPGGNRFLTGASDKTARLWDESGQVIRQFKGHRGWVLSVAFSPDGNYVLTGSMDKTARLWDLDGKLLQEFNGHTGWVYSAAFSPHGQHILTGSSDKTARLWDLQGFLITVFKGHLRSVTTAAFSPSTRNILTGSADHTLRLWKPDGTIVQEFTGHFDRVCSAAFSPCGFYIISASNDRTARLWDLKGNTLHVLKGHRQPVTAAAFSPRSNRVFTVSVDRTLRVWQLKGRELNIFSGHTDRIFSVAFSTGGKFVLTGSKDRTVRLWDVNGNQLRVFNGPAGSVVHVAFSHGSNKNNTHDNFHITARTEDGTVHVWDMNGNLVQVTKGFNNKKPSTVYSHDRKYKISLSGNGTVYLEDREGNRLQVFRGHHAHVSSAAFSPCGKYVLTGSFDHTARLWEIDVPLKRKQPTNK